MKPNKAYVITIPRLEQRRKILLDKWNEKVEIEFFYGYDCKDLGIDSNRYVSINAPHLFIGATFYKLFDKLLDTNQDKWLIFEDDAWPTEAWNEFDWNSIDDVDYDMIKLNCPELSDPPWNNTCHLPNDLPEGLINVKKYGSWVGMCAFIITRNGIKRLIEETYIAPIDHIAGHKLNWVVTNPILVGCSGNCSYT
jgi:hypothetical protein